MRMWSVTTWIIVICSATFIIDRIIPPSLWIPTVVEARVARDAGPNIKDRPLNDEDRRIQWQRDIVDLDTGRVVGHTTILRMPPLESWLHFSTAKGFARLQVWRLIGFQFLHYNFTHILFNMIGLFFFGTLVERYLGRKRFLAFYLLCGIFGALMYLVLNLGGVIVESMTTKPVSIPGLLFNDPHTPLVGASAGVFGVLMAGAYIAPRERVYVFMLIPVELRPLAYILVGLAVFTILTGGQNAGGEAGHIGGALAGAYFIRHPHHLHGFFDLIGRADPTAHHYRKRPPRVEHASTLDQAKLDEILDKVTSHGMDSLTAAERELLHRMTRHMRE